MIIAAKRSVQWAAVLTMLSASACSFQEKKAETNVKAANSNEVTAASKDSVSKIAVDLLKNIPADANGNRFMSPLSIQTALSMVAEGATDTTLVEMEKLLGSNLASLRSSNKSLLAALNGPKGYKLEVANSMWTRQDLTLKPSFKTILTQNYDASVQPVNFEDAATLALINPHNFRCSRPGSSLTYRKRNVF